MKEYLDRAQKSNSVIYDLIDRNCVKGVNDVLESGGLDTPKGIKGIHPATYMDKWKKLLDK
ncbi:hypothetical protein [Pseudodesulfovibrio mercurii]|uniref:hypothetical protein n=1 Tax=Pseudodesulfovibrio mercurii TaxID=641491 RepID=UPI0011D1E5C9|nr:hypothetical protein [Pseudodesulfovibrio mercurii]